MTPSPGFQIAELCIDRCVCVRVPFERLLPVARQEGWDLPALIAATGCGDQCGMCRPYLAAMLRDGTTIFRTILSADNEGEPS
jgi:bacterioferritin-associated ferredoxin